MGPDKDEFICQLQSEHPACRSEVKGLLDDMLEVKVDLHEFKKEVRERLPYSNPWWGRTIAAIISILSTATFMYSALLVPMSNRLTDIEKTLELTLVDAKQVDEAIEKAITKIAFPWNEVRVQKSETALANLQQAVLQVQLGLAKAGIGVGDSQQFHYYGGPEPRPTVNLPGDN